VRLNRAVDRIRHRLPFRILDIAAQELQRSFSEGHQRFTIELLEV